MQCGTVRMLLVVIFMVVVRSGFGEELFDFSRIPASRHKELQEAFDKAFAGWKLEVLDTDRFEFSSDLNGYFANQHFVDLVKLGPAAMPYYVDTMRKNGFAGWYFSFISTYLMSGCWQELSDLSINRTSSAPVDARTEEQILTWWKDVAHQCVMIWETRRKAFDERLKVRPIVIEDLNYSRKEKEFAALRSMGLYGVPSVIKRIQAGTSDVYDLYLLNMWAAPIIVDTVNLKSYYGGIDTILPRARRAYVPPKEYNTDPAHWLQWWEANKADYWWLMEK